MLCIHRSNWVVSSFSKNVHCFFVVIFYIFSFCGLLLFTQRLVEGRIHILPTRIAMLVFRTLEPRQFHEVEFCILGVLIFLGEVQSRQVSCSLFLLQGLGTSFVSLCELAVEAAAAIYIFFPFPALHTTSLAIFGLFFPFGDTIGFRCSIFPIGAPLESILASKNQEGRGGRPAECCEYLFYPSSILLYNLTQTTSSVLLRPNHF
jgi:hypothetical protein